MADSKPGWFGLSRHVTHVLGTLGADRDEAGQYLIGGTVSERTDR